MSTMRAVVFDRYGPPEILAVEELVRPDRRPGEILIRVKAAESGGSKKRRNELATSHGEGTSWEGRIPTEAGGN